jgi:hypothetical protein
VHIGVLLTQGGFLLCPKSLLCCHHWVFNVVHAMPRYLRQQRCIRQGSWPRKHTVPTLPQIPTQPHGSPFSENLLHPIITVKHEISAGGEYFHALPSTVEIYTQRNL